MLDAGGGGEDEVAIDGGGVREDVPYGSAASVY